MVCSVSNDSTNLFTNFRKYLSKKISNEKYIKHWGKIPRREKFKLHLLKV